ncbi:putative MFS transporter [Auriculariales sp. MPI-PUGE-AT-0066]|nr:putative MFS transporter [Auriculariales sp. MPI-PUGE-AT-0066]
MSGIKPHDTSDQASASDKDTVNEERQAAIPSQGIGRVIQHDKNQIKRGDIALAVLGDQRVIVTPAEDRAIRIKTDKTILALLVWLYFLQILDKTVIGTSTAFGLRQDAHLVGNDYSNMTAIGYYGQLTALLFTTTLMVKLPLRQYAFVIVFCWVGSLCSLLGMAFAHNFAGLAATRCLLGFFEASCLPLFTIVITNFYKRSEQPIRALFYGTNGIATIFSSFLGWALSFAPTTKLHSYQVIFLTTALMTIVTAPFIWWKLDSNVATARFLTPEERIKAIERLRANNSGTGSIDFKWHHLWETLYDTKTYFWLAMSLFINAGASVTGAFGPLLLSSFGYTSSPSRILTLLNMPFGALQTIIILGASWSAYRWSNKAIPMFFINLPVIAALAVLYTNGRGVEDRNANLGAYYLLAFLFAGNPLILAWLGANTGGSTKKAFNLTGFQVMLSVGNIVSPYLFRAHDAPNYYPALRSILAFFVANAITVILTVLYLSFLNKRHERSRIAEGKPATIKDLSMQHERQEMDAESQITAVDERLGTQAFLDLTDMENNEFIYVY